MAQSFNVVEATIEDIHAAYKSGELTCRRLVQMYLDRIEAFDKKGPAINAVITTNSDALKEADRLDAAYKASGPVGPLRRSGLHETAVRDRHGLALGNREADHLALG